MYKGDSMEEKFAMEKFLECVLVYKNEEEKELLKIIYYIIGIKLINQLMKIINAFLELNIYHNLKRRYH